MTLPVIEMDMVEKCCRMAERIASEIPIDLIKTVCAMAENMADINYLQKRVDKGVEDIKLYAFEAEAPENDG